MERISKKDLEALGYRKKRMTAKARQIDLLLSGRSKSLLPLVRAPRGRYSEVQAQRLVKKLAGALEHLRVDREFFGSFLYCAVRLAERGPSRVWGPGFEWIVDGTFQDLLYLAFTVDPWGDRYDRWHQEFGAGEGQSPCFALMDDLYRRFSGEPIRRTLARLLPEIPEKAAARYGPEPEDEEEAVDWEEYQEEEWIPEDLTDEELALMEEFDKQDTLEAEEWERSFPAKDSFCQAYLLCRRRCFETEDIRGLAPLVEQALDVFLCQAGVSGYLRDDDFFAAYGLLDRSASRLRALLKEVR